MTRQFIIAFVVSFVWSIVAYRLGARHGWNKANGGRRVLFRRYCTEQKLVRSDTCLKEFGVFLDVPLMFQPGDVIEVSMSTMRK